MTRDGLRPLRKARRMDLVRSTEERRLAPGVAEVLLRAVMEAMGLPIPG